MDTFDGFLRSADRKSKSPPYHNHSSLFQEYLNAVTTDSPKYGKQVVKQRILYFLTDTPYDERFFFNKIPQILEESAGNDDKFDVEKASKAFEHLEKYILLIAESPWKTELKQLKLYNGFFRVNVQAHLSKAVEVLAIIGFQETGNDSIQLTKTVRLDLCYKVAFDVLVASVECHFLNPAVRCLLPQGFSHYEIIKAHRYVTGNVDIFIQYVERNCEKKSREQSGKLTESNSLEKTSDAVIHKHVLMKRPLIRDGGLSIPDSGYLSMYHSSASRLSTRPKPLGQTPDHYDSPNIFNQPLYEEGTVDDHISYANQFIASLGPSKKPLKESTSVGSYEAKAGSEWNFVRDSLMKKYGQGYYDGERGDILQTRPSRSMIVHSSENTKVPSGIVIKQKPGSPKLPPRVSSASRNSPHRLPDQDFNRQLESVVNYPPPLVCRGSKPSYLPSRVSLDEYDGVLSEDCGPRSPPVEVPPYIPTLLPRRNSPSELLFGDVDTTASTKSALFKNKLQNYERLEQQLSFSADQPNMETNSSENSSWKCPTCTLRNKGGDRICSMCGKSGDSGPDLTYQTYARVCTQCTFNNEPDARVCAMCEIELDSYETVV